MSEPIYLNVYDHNMFNNITSFLGFGFYHLGIEIYGTEYSFNLDKGVFSISPKSNENYQYKETIYLGSTNLNYYEIYNIINNLKLNFEHHNGVNNFQFCNKLNSILTKSKFPNYICRVNYLTNIVNSIFLKTDDNIIIDTRFKFDDIESNILSENKVE